MFSLGAEQMSQGLVLEERVSRAIRNKCSEPLTAFLEGHTVLEGGVL